MDKNKKKQPSFIYWLLVMKPRGAIRFLKTANTFDRGIAIALVLIFSGLVAVPFNIPLAFSMVVTGLLTFLVALIYDAYEMDVKKY